MNCTFNPLDHPAAEVTPLLLCSPPPPPPPPR